MNEDTLDATAVFIAIKCYGLTRESLYREMLPEQVVSFYEELVHALPPPYDRYLRWLKRPGVRRLAARVDELLLKGDLMHVLLRKKVLTGQVERLADQGCRQLIVLGAGVDHLSWYGTGLGLQTIEFDRPPMAAFKKRFLENLEAPARTPSSLSRENIPGPEILAGDVEYGSLVELLEESGTYQPDLETIVVAEGFFDYLEPSTVKQLLAGLSREHRAPIHLLSTVFDLSQLSMPQRLAFRGGVRLARQRLKLNLDVGGFRNLLLEAGWETVRVWDREEMRSAHLSPHGISAPLLRGFHILHARL